MRHVDEGELHAHLDGALAAVEPSRAVEVERHLERCDACRARLEHARRERDLATGLLRGADAAPAAVPPFEAVRRRASRGGGVRPRRRVALAWAASLVLALGAGWLARGVLRGPAPTAVAVREQPASAARVADAGAGPTAAPAAAPAAPAEAVAEPGPERAVVRTRASSAPLDPRGDRSAPVAALAAPAAPEQGRSAAPAAEPATQAADFVVSGRVVDRAGRGVAGVQVAIPALSRGTVSDRQGNYSLAVPAAATTQVDTLTVLARGIGLREQARQVPAAPGRVATQNFQLDREAVALEGLVVTGSAPAAVAAAPPPPPASRAPREADDAVGWRAADLPEAERWLGRAPLTVRRLPVLGLEVAMVDGTPAVRVRQRLESGAELRLVQRAAPEAGAAEDPDDAEVVLHHRGLRVSAQAPVPADSLRALLLRLR